MEKETSLLTPANALAVIAKHIREDEQYRKTWVGNISDAVVHVLGDDYATRNASYQIAEALIQKMFSQWHNPNAINGGFYWVRFKSDTEMTAAYYQGNGRYLVVGSDRSCMENEFDRFIRIAPPEMALKGMEEEAK
jgi:hypothetical protein